MSVKLHSNRRRSGGFVLIEFAIALPLLILVAYGLTSVGVKIFQVGRNQLADYVLESEARYVMERITQQARVAEQLRVENSIKNVSMIKFVYHTVEDRGRWNKFNDEKESRATIDDVRETQFYVPRIVSGEVCVSLNAKRLNVTSLVNPITGGNSFGDTKINLLKYRELNDNVLHITLEMESLVTGHKVKISTAVFMPRCKKKEGLPRE